MHAFVFSSHVASVPLLAWFVLFCLKHVLCDFIWQPTWMAIGKEQATGWARPLLLHCLIHGAATLVLLLTLRPGLCLLAIADFAVHISIDRVKGIVLSRRGWTPNDRPFWTILGVDQTLHHATGFGLALLIALQP